jgi:hypothetical protein
MKAEAKSLRFLGESPQKLTIPFFQRHYVWKEENWQELLESLEGKDHQICGDYIDREILSRYAPRYGCAKCNISVPCEDRNPTA